MLISLIPLPWSLFNQTHYVCGKQGYGFQRCLVLVPRICYLTWQRNASNGIQVLELVMGAGFQGGHHLITSLKAEDFSLSRVSQGDAWKRGGVNVSVKSCWWLWSWRRGSWLKECGWPLARWNGPRWKPASVQGPQPSSCKGMNSDHMLPEQEDRLSPGASGREHSSDATFSLIWRDPKTFLNCKIIHLCFKSFHLWQHIIATKEN